MRRDTGGGEISKGKPRVRKQNIDSINFNWQYDRNIVYMLVLINFMKFIMAANYNAINQNDGINKTYINYNISCTSEFILKKKVHLQINYVIQVERTNTRTIIR